MCIRDRNNVQGASDAGLIPMVYPDYQPVEDINNHKKMQEFWDTELDQKKGLTVVEIIDKVCEGQIKGMYVMGENPVMSDPDQNHTIEGMCKLDTLVVQDIFMTETAWYADIILPASAHAEKNGTFTNTNRQVQMGRKVINPPGEAKEDLEIINDLGKALGLDWNYNHPSEVLKLGKEIEVKVLKYSEDTNRLSLGIKQLTPDPWEGTIDKLKKGEKRRLNHSSLKWSDLCK